MSHDSCNLCLLQGPLLLGKAAVRCWDTSKVNKEKALFNMH